MLKSLVKISVTDDEEAKTIGELALNGDIEIRDPIYVKRQTDINDIMKQFQRGHLHQAVVCDEPDALLKELEAFHHLISSNRDKVGDVDAEVGSNAPKDPQVIYDEIKDETESFNVTGIVSMENVLESLLGMQILDEKDDQKRRRATMASKSGFTRDQSAFMRAESTFLAGVNNSDNASNRDRDDDFFDAEKEAGVYKAEYLNKFFSKMQGDIVRQVQDDLKYRQATSVGTVPGMKKKRVRRDTLNE